MTPFQGLGFLLGFTWGDAPGYHIWASLGPWMMARRKMGRRGWEGLWGEGRVRSLAVPGLFGWASTEGAELGLRAAMGGFGIGGEGESVANALR